MRSILVIILVLFSNLNYSQNLYQIEDTTKIWNTVQGGYGAFMVAYCSGTKSNKFEGEANIGDKTYLKVYESSDSLQTNWEQVGYIREDTINQLVYFHAGWGDEGLIYDFNLDIGDSIYIDNYYIDFTDALLICDSIDSVNINGNFKKRYYFLPAYSNSYYADIWIEGTGSIYGLLYSGIGGAGYAGGFSELLCCTKNDTIIYIDSAFNTCYIDKFYPKITSEYFDTAYLGKTYEFQLQLSDTITIDSIGWKGEYIPDGFNFDETTGILSGIPSTTGSFPCVITIRNYDIGYITDIIYSNITVLLPAKVNNNSEQFDIKVYPNPCNTNLYIAINIKKTADYYLEIINSSGSVIEKRIIRNRISEIDFTHYKKGVYLFKVTNSENRIIKIEKVIKK